MLENQKQYNAINEALASVYEKAETKSELEKEAETIANKLTGLELEYMTFEQYRPENDDKYEDPDYKDIIFTRNKKSNKRKTSHKYEKTKLIKRTEADGHNNFITWITDKPVYKLIHQEGPWFGDSRRNEEHKFYAGTALPFFFRNLLSSVPELKDFKVVEDYEQYYDYNNKPFSKVLDNLERDEDFIDYYYKLEKRVNNKNKDPKITENEYITFKIIIKEQYIDYKSSNQINYIKFELSYHHEGNWNTTRTDFSNDSL